MRLCPSLALKSLSDSVFPLGFILCPQLFFLIHFLFFFLFRAAPVAYGNSRTRGWVRAAPAAYATAMALPDLSCLCDLCCSCGNARCLTHWKRPGMKPESSRTLCQFLNSLGHKGNSSFVLNALPGWVHLLFGWYCYLPTQRPFSFLFSSNKTLIFFPPRVGEQNMPSLGGGEWQLISDSNNNLILFCGIPFLLTLSWAREVQEIKF